MRVNETQLKRKCLEHHRLNSLLCKEDSCYFRWVEEEYNQLDDFYDLGLTYKTQVE